MNCGALAPATTESMAGALRLPRPSRATTLNKYSLSLWSTSPVVNTWPVFLSTAKQPSPPAGKYNDIIFQQWIQAHPTLLSWILNQKYYPNGNFEIGDCVLLGLLSYNSYRGYMLKLQLKYNLRHYKRVWTHKWSNSQAYLVSLNTIFLLCTTRKRPRLGLH